MHRAFIVFITFTCFCLSANGQVGSPIVLEEIVVNADYRQSKVTDIPSSVTILDANLIQQKNAQHLEDILFNAPNVNFSSGASRARFYQIRGIGERGQFSEPLNSSVGVIIDGVDFSGIGNAALLYDVEQVEILLGPQGTRYGSNALAGLINLQSKAPTNKTSYGLQLENANHNSTGLAGYLSGSASNQLRYRLSAQSLKSDGFNTNQFLLKETNQRDESIVRGKFDWSISDYLQLDVTASTINIDNGYDAFSLDNVRDTLTDEPGFDRQQSNILSTKLSFTQFERFKVEALFGYADSETEYAYDEDWVFSGFHPWEYSSTDQYFRDRKTLSSELRFISSDSGLIFSDTTDWVFGFYSLQQEADLRRIYTFLPTEFSSKYDINRFAVYGEINSNFSNNWSLSLGFRGENFDATYFDSNAVNFTPNENLYGGKLALTYRALENGLIYASISKGYKNGGFNTDGSLDSDLREFNAEELINYEFGFKGSLFNNQLQTQLALFFMDRDEVQISSSVVRTRANGSSEFIDYVGNAAAGSNYGLEISAKFQATDKIMFNGSLGLLKTKYKDFINSTGDNLEGRQQAHAPDYQYTLGGDIRISSELKFNINIQGKDSFYFSDSHSIRSKDYNLVNASLSYSWNEWKLTLWGRNLSDKDYSVRGFFFGNDPRDNYIAKGYTQLGEPIRYGLTLNMDL
jgi:outer membrane receptor protein involved in Fe transport